MRRIRLLSRRPRAGVVGRRPRAGVVASVVLALALMLGSTVAQADEVTVGVGLIGALGGNFIDKPSDQSVQVGSDSGEPPNGPDYPGFMGMTAGIGGLLDLRIMEYGGVELDVYWSKDRGSAEITYRPAGSVTGEDFKIRISQTAVHIPILFKAILPGDLVQPMIFVGPELVVSRKVECDDSDNVIPDQTFGAVGGGYTMVTFGLGVEFKLPLPVIDLRIPLHMRVGINPGVEDKRMDREIVEGTSLEQIDRIDYKTEFQYQAVVTLGAGLHF